MRYETKNISILEEFIDERIELINAATLEIKKVEEILKKSGIPSSFIEFDGKSILKWNDKLKRLTIVVDTIEKPALEHKVDIRLKAWMALEEFIETITNGGYVKN